MNYSHRKSFVDIIQSFIPSIVLLTKACPTDSVNVFIIQVYQFYRIYVYYMQPGKFVHNLNADEDTDTLS